MHLIMAIIVIIAVWWKKDYKNWEKYHTTMLYFAVINLTYNFLCSNYFLWKFDPDLLINHSITEMLYTLIVFPGTVLMFLTHYPPTFKKRILYNLLWIALYIGIEGVYLLVGKIYYQHGWSIQWSIVLVAIMFPMLRLHHKRPIFAYLLSVFITAFFMWYFEVPLGVPIEERSG
ncbi:CBO0543 family protein [Halalkalibacter okhensis]|uniref:Uncharacterized protein n=1 Tax=Halalkalibacter okhensis TaxID=333138 RepID=A0A0B0IKR8_9BACI|nr:CBO0543 family protein [Halalkalibacter okhensis]KHF40261.1 hypothetical protein LQ50_11010 [Halalkalibacter okhensis]